MRRLLPRRRRELLETTFLIGREWQTFGVAMWMRMQWRPSQLKHLHRAQTQARIEAAPSLLGKPRRPGDPRATRRFPYKCQQPISP